MMKYNEDVKELFRRTFGENTAAKLAKRLYAYNVHTLDQLQGKLNPFLPAFNTKEIYAKGLTSNYAALSKNSTSDKQKIKRLKSSLKISAKEAQAVLNSLNAIKFPKVAMKSNKSVLSLGLKGSYVKFPTPFWSDAKFNTPKESFVLPDYARAGRVFDQGNRGTCVANAYCALFDYVTGEEISRQFLFHQCKMTDGVTDSDGTYLHIPVKLLTEKSIVDYGVVCESDWKYNSSIGRTTHQGPPPEKCFDTTRFFCEKVISTRKATEVEDIKNLLAGSNLYPSMPVVVGIPLYESFNNRNSIRTGWITLPLPGEQIIGGHAMLIAGYFDEVQMFLVRNSWGTGWAAENPYGYPGHALIPYEYFRKYMDTNGWAIPFLDKRQMSVSLNERLYKKNVHFHAFGRKAAAKKSGKATKTRRKPKKHKRNIRLKYFILGIFTTLAVIYYIEVITLVKEIVHWLQKL